MLEAEANSISHSCQNYITAGSQTKRSGFDQRVAQAHPGVLMAASPAEVSAFNFVIVLVYALTIGVILWIYRRHSSKFDGPLISHTDSIQ